ncbi:hypothetical protein CHS0354_040363 [Potamilus streckersoni]|uniref:Uncharacterized protein n=1 Tax=Potamilus streckersoni TaxID=2493646 RepID=A0AAE0VNJ3_9BIVA|nr:hypothetical protein CHS0354_040363 [Potamilus streckersoni]
MEREEQQKQNQYQQEYEEKVQPIRQGRTEKRVISSLTFSLPMLFYRLGSYGGNDKEEIVDNMPRNKRRDKSSGQRERPQSPRELAISTPEDNNHEQQQNLPKNDTLEARPKSQNKSDLPLSTSTSQERFATVVARSPARVSLPRLEVPCEIHDAVEAHLEMSSSSNTEEIKDFHPS